MAPFTSRAERRTSPSPCRSALSTRFPSACSSRSRSPRTRSPPLVRGSTGARHANLLATAGHFGTVDDLTLVLRMATEHGARALRLPEHGVREGARADLVVLDCAEPAEAVASIPERLMVIKNGRLTVTNHVETTFHRP